MYIITALTAASCLHPSVSAEYTGEPIYLTEENTFLLLSPSVLDEDIELTQMIEGRYRDTEYYLHAWISADSQAIEQTAFTVMGIEAYSLYFSDIEYSFESGFFTGNTNPLYMVADFQLIYYPWESVKRGIEKAGLKASQKVLSGGWVRRIYTQDRDIIHITRRGTAVEYKNLLRDYEYTINEERAEQ